MHQPLRHFSVLSAALLAAALLPSNAVVHRTRATGQRIEPVVQDIYGWTDIRPGIEEDFDIVRNAANALGITEAG